MASRKITDCDSRLQYAWPNALYRFKTIHPEVTPFLTCSFRSFAEQDALYAQGRTVEGRIVTQAKAGQSAHNYLPAQAFDIAFKNDEGKLTWNEEYFYDFARFMNTIDKTIVWGGNWKRFKDLPHFETNDWRKLIV